MTKKKKDYITGIVFLCFSVALFIAAGNFPTKEDGSLALSPGFYPQMLAVLLAVLSVILIITTLLKKTDAEDAPMWQSKKSLLLYLLTVGLLLLYPIFLSHIGFAVSTFLFITTLIFSLSEQKKEKFVLNLSIAIGITVLIYIVFKLILKIPFPMGLLF